MSKLKNFPFKSMIPIINFLSSHASNSQVDISDIMSASNACYPDTLEVVQMLSYLTSFGSVSNHGLGWTLEHGQPFTNRKTFREYFLNDVLKIISSLNAEPKDISIVNELVQDIDKNELQSILAFLQTITSYGIVKKSEQGWIVESYATSKSFSSPSD